jgi:hypothetical protein
MPINATPPPVGTQRADGILTIRRFDKALRLAEL